MDGRVSRILAGSPRPGVRRQPGRILPRTHGRQSRQVREERAGHPAELRLSCRRHALRRVSAPIERGGRRQARGWQNPRGQAARTDGRYRGAGARQRGVDRGRSVYRLHRVQGAVDRRCPGRRRRRLEPLAGRRPGHRRANRGERAAASIHARDRARIGVAMAHSPAKPGRQRHRLQQPVSCRRRGAGHPVAQSERGNPRRAAPAELRHRPSQQSLGKELRRDGLSRWFRGTAGVHEHPPGNDRHLPSHPAVSVRRGPPSPGAPLQRGDPGGNGGGQRLYRPALQAD